MFTWVIEKKDWKKKLEPIAADGDEAKNRCYWDIEGWYGRYMIGVMGWVEWEKIMLVQEIARRAINDKFFDKVIIAEITLTKDQKHNLRKNCLWFRLGIWSECIWKSWSEWRNIMFILIDCGWFNEIFFFICILVQLIQANIWHAHLAAVTVVGKSAGLPLAIKTIASALKN